MAAYWARASRNPGCQGASVRQLLLVELVVLVPVVIHLVRLSFEPEPTPAAIDDSGDGMPAITIQGRPTISNDDVVAAIWRDRSTR